MEVTISRKVEFKKSVTITVKVTSYNDETKIADIQEGLKSALETVKDVYPSGGEY